MSLIKKYTKFLEEKELTLDELGKLKGSELRGNVLVNKLKKHEPFTTLNNQSIEVQKMKDNGRWVSIEDAIENLTDPNGDYDIDKGKNYFTKSKRYLSVFKDEDGDEFKLNQLKKTKEFGSSGAGRLTRELESIQAIFIAIKQSKPNEKLLPSNILEFYDTWIAESNKLGRKLLYVPDISLDRTELEKLIKDKNWAKTFCDIPNELWIEDKHIDHRKTYVIYHMGYKADSPILTLQKLYNKFSKLEKFTEINFAKWCPADVFMISTEIVDNISNIFNETKNIQELTTKCDELFDQGLFIPLSLKKIGKSKILIITNKEVDKDLPYFEINRFQINLGDFTGIGSKIHTTDYWKYRNKEMSTKKDRTLNIDSSNTSKKVNVDGEVEGSTSRHGKISLNAIKSIIKRITEQENIQSVSDIQDSKELKKLNIEQLEQEVINLNRELKGRPKVVRYPIERGSNISGDEGRLISRIQSLQVVLALNEIYRIKPEIANRAITSIMRYALSIQTDRFESPRYLRIL